MRGRSITLAEFEQANRVMLNDTEIDMFEALRGDLEASIFTALATEEAKERNLDTSAYIAAEITDKLRQFTDEERASVEDALMRRLFAKYNVSVSLPEPTPIVQGIAIEATIPNGTRGSRNGGHVHRLSMPACSATHPVVKQTLTQYGEKFGSLSATSSLDHS